MNADDLRDLFRSFGAVGVRRMFGGAGIYADGVMFALVADDAIYLKAGESNAADFDREGLAPFSYTAKNGRRAVTSYRRMPERLYDDPDELAEWAARALRVAQSAKAPRRAGKARPPAQKSGRKPRKTGARGRL